MIMGDLGVHSTMEILEDLRAKVKERHIKEPIECRQLLIDSIREQMDVGETAYEFENRTSVVFVIGVNGVGKTTTIGKLAGKLKSQGKRLFWRQPILFVLRRENSFENGRTVPMQI